MTQRIWLITGVSSGFGRHLSEHCLIAVTASWARLRRPDSVADLTDRYRDTFCPEVLDVRDTAALRSAVDRTAADFGRIDVAVNNAGYGLFGAAEELSESRSTPSSPPTSPDPSS